jgi:hypothetical protein
MASEEFEKTIQNVFSYGKVFPRDYAANSIIVEGRDPKKMGWTASCKIHLHNTPIKQFITTYALRTPLPKIGYHLIDICYIDPSWCAKELLIKEKETAKDNTDRNRQAYDYQHIPETLEQEADPDIVMSYIVNQIMAPLEAASPKIVIDVLCLKVRFELSSAQMQKKMDESRLANRFLVLYAVQALPNVHKRDTKEVDGEIVIMDHDAFTHTSKQRESVRLSDGTKIVKGQFHWLVMRNITYKKIRDSKRPWAEAEMLGGHPQPVYVLRGTAMAETSKPQYGQKVLERPVLTKKEFSGLQPQEQEAYEEIEAVRSIELVHEEDMLVYTGMLNDLDTALHKKSEEYEKEKVISLIENILGRTEMYENPKEYTSTVATELQRTRSRLDAAVTDFYRVRGILRKIIGKPPKPRHTRADLGDLLQQLRGL